MKINFRKWRILHQAKLARRKGDVKKLNSLAIQYEKCLNRESLG